MGCWSVAVLNLNNMRDVKNDVKNNKITVASKLGFQKSKILSNGFNDDSFRIKRIIYVTMSPLKQGKLSGFVFLILIFFANAIRSQIFAVKRSKRFRSILETSSNVSFIFRCIVGI